jgi:L-aminopeptidase/D-esterase-like protein
MSRHVLSSRHVLAFGTLLLFTGTSLSAQAPANASATPRPRARELGISALIGGSPGALDAITDVAGVEVGHTTLIEGEGRRQVGTGPIRTGVTVVHPRGHANIDPVFGAWFTLNGNGEMTGTTWLRESGVLEGPLAITNTHSVGVVRDAILQWQVSRPGMQPWGLPIVAETYDGGLNDINGFHVKPAHVIAALDGARGGAVPEGNVGGGTGMVCHGFKGGIGTASRVLSTEAGGYTVGVLVQCNYGSRRELRVAGVPVGEEIADLLPCVTIGDPTVAPGRPRCDAATPPAAPAPRENDASANASASGAVDGTIDTATNVDVDARGSTGSRASGKPGRSPKATTRVNADEDPDADTGAGSIIIVIATDAPLLPHQLQRLATRAALGVGRMGGKGENSSGDIFVAFSTANPKTASAEAVTHLDMLPNTRINGLFYATVQATEEAILNAMLAATTMTGADGLRVSALPQDRLLAALRKYSRLHE